MKKINRKLAAVMALLSGVSVTAFAAPAAMQQRVNPLTGDDFNMRLCITVMAICVVGIAAILVALLIAQSKLKQQKRQQAQQECAESEESEEYEEYNAYEEYEETDPE